MTSRIKGHNFSLAWIPQLLFNFLSRRTWLVEAKLFWLFVKQTHLDFETHAGVAVKLVVDGLRATTLDVVVVVIVVVVVLLNDDAEENYFWTES